MYYSGDQIEEDEIGEGGGDEASMGEMRNAQNIFGWKT
jgi:hypothetical protein